MWPCTWKPKTDARYSALPIFVSLSWNTVSLWTQSQADQQTHLACLWSAPHSTRVTSMCTLPHLAFYDGAVIQTQGLMLAQCSDLPTQPPSPKLLRNIILQRLYEIGHIKAFSTSTPKKQENNKYPLKSKTKYLLKQSVIHSLVLKCLGI